MKNKLLKILLITFITLLIFPPYIKAATVKATKYDPFGNKTYYTKGWNKSLIKGYTANSYRLTSNLEIFSDNTNGNLVFCIEPGAKFVSNASYTRSNTTPEIYNSNWKLTDAKKSSLKKVMSCYYNQSEYGNPNAIIATQALVWEIMTGERSTIDSNRIFNKASYAPYQSNGTIYLSGDSKKSLYEVVTANSSVYGAYKKILRCAARFNAGATPSFADTTKVLPITKAATASTKATYSTTLKVDSGNKAQVDLFKYYKCSIGSKEADCTSGLTQSGVTLKCTGSSCTITTNTPIPKEKPVKITFNYAYREGVCENKKCALKNIADCNKDECYYTRAGAQTLMIGTLQKSFTFNIYTGSAPIYKIAVEKIDENNQRITTGTAKFDVYSDQTLKTKVCSITTKNGVGECEVKSTGTYYVKETEAPAGYVMYTGVSKGTISGTKSITVPVKVKNKSKILHMDKKTINPETGQQESLSGDACSVKTCEVEGGRQNGPIFNIKSGDDYVCVEESDNGTYKYSSTSKTCKEGTTNEIKTCNGSFDIKNIPNGSYEVKEIATVCGATLPSDPTKKIEINESDSTKTITMENGVSGITFNKLSESGSLLSGGKFSLQQKQGGVYKDILLKHKAGAIYLYQADLTESSSDATYILQTEGGMINVQGLPVGEYRFVEKEAPTGYDPIKDKDSTAIFNVKDSSEVDIQVDLINKKTKATGSDDSAELIVTITTGRKVPNYVFIISALSILLIIVIILRKKFKK